MFPGLTEVILTIHPKKCSIYHRKHTNI